MKIHKLLRKKRAVSPILAAILLIGLAVAAGAVLFIVVLPLIESPGEFYFSSVKFSDVDDNGTNDKVVFTLTNEASQSVTITNIELQAGETPITNANTTTTFPFTITLGKSKIDITYIFAEPASSAVLRIKVEYKIGDDVQDPLYSADYDAAA